MDVGKEIVSIFLCFDHFLEISENLDWFKFAARGQVETLLTNASKLENVCKEMTEKGLASQFQDKLHKWWFYRQMPYCYELNYFKDACDKVLRNTLLSSDSESVMEYTVCGYLRICGEDRFCNLVKQIIVEGISYRVLYSIFLGSESSIGVDMRSHLLLAYWMKELSLSGQGVVAKQIQDSNDESLCAILNILTFDLKEQEFQVQEIILKQLLCKMDSDETVFFIITVDSEILSNVCEKYPSFLDVLLNNLIRVGSSFHCSYGDNGVKWTSNHEGMTFELLVQLLKCLCHKNCLLKSKLLAFIQQLINEPGCSLWEDIGRECSIF